ncbi:MAG: DNA internalization-related competence protein ComEC/Rec2 [Desulfobacterales bacterium]
MARFIETPSRLFDRRYYFRPLIPLLFALMAGISAAHTLPGFNKPALFLCITAGTFIFGLVFLDRPARLSPLIFFCALGYLSLVPWQVVQDRPNHLCQYSRDAEKSWEITGRIATDPIRQSYRVKFLLSDLRISKPNHPETEKYVRGNLRMRVYGPRQELRRHDSIQFQSPIRPFHNFSNPGGFDYKSFMAYQNVWASAYASGSRLEVEQTGPVNPAAAVLDRMRQAVSQLIESAAAGDKQAVLSALVLGQREALSPALKTAFNRAGASHVLAISGLHIGIVAAFAFFVFKRSLRLWPPILQRGWTRKFAAVLTVIPVLIYGLLAGMSPSTQRAVLMVSVFLFSFLIEREHDLLNTLAIAAMVILILYPPALFSISFQLSFMAVLAIIIGISNTGHWRAGFQTHRLIAPVLSFMMVSLFAILGTTPLTMHYFNQAAFFGLFTNLLIIPIIGFFVVPLSLFSILVLFPLYAPLAAWGLKAAGFGIELGLAVIYPIGEWPFSAAKTVTPSLLELTCVYILLFGFLYLLGRAERQLLSRAALKQPAVFIIAAASIVLASDIAFWCHDRFWKNELSATIVDVGQGSAALLELPAGYRMLVDGGGFTSNAMFDVGKNVLAPLLWDRKIRTIDTVVLSHPDSDHLNGLIYILNHFHVDRVISTHQKTESQGYEAFLEAIRKHKIKHLRLDQISRRFHINGVTFDILYPPAADAGGSIQTDAKNNHSIVLKAAYNGQALLLTGDIMKTAEKRLVTAAAEKLHASVMLAPHHGSKTSSTKAFLEAVSPRAAVISAGPQNRFDLPAPGVIKRYRKRGCQIFQTNQNGAVEVVFGADHMDLIPVRGEPLRLFSKNQN